MQSEGEVALLVQCTMGALPWPEQKICVSVDSIRALDLSAVKKRLRHAFYDRIGTGKMSVWLQQTGPTSSVRLKAKHLPSLLDAAGHAIVLLGPKPYAKVTKVSGLYEPRAPQQPTMVIKPPAIWCNKQRCTQAFGPRYSGLIAHNLHAGPLAGKERPMPAHLTPPKVYTVVAKVVGGGTAVFMESQVRSCPFHVEFWAVDGQGRQSAMPRGVCQLFDAVGRAVWSHEDRWPLEVQVLQLEASYGGAWAAEVTLLTRLPLDLGLLVPQPKVALHIDFKPRCSRQGSKLPPVLRTLQPLEIELHPGSVRGYLCSLDKAVLPQDRASLVQNRIPSGPLRAARQRQVLSTTAPGQPPATAYDREPARDAVTACGREPALDTVPASGTVPACDTTPTCSMVHACDRELVHIQAPTMSWRWAWATSTVHTTPRAVPVGCPLAALLHPVHMAECGQLHLWQPGHNTTPWVSVAAECTGRQARRGCVRLCDSQGDQQPQVPWSPSLRLVGPAHQLVTLKLHEASSSTGHHQVQVILTPGPFTSFRAYLPPAKHLHLSHMWVRDLELWPVDAAGNPTALPDGLPQEATLHMDCPALLTGLVEAPMRQRDGYLELQARFLLQFSQFGEPRVTGRLFTLGQDHKQYHVTFPPLVISPSHRILKDLAVQLVHPFTAPLAAVGEDGEPQALPLGAVAVVRAVTETGKAAHLKQLQRHCQAWLQTPLGTQLELRVEQQHGGGLSLVLASLATLETGSGAQTLEAGLAGRYRVLCSYLDQDIAYVKAATAEFTVHPGPIKELKALVPSPAAGGLPELQGHTCASDPGRCMAIDRLELAWVDIAGNEVAWESGSTPKVTLEVLQPPGVWNLPTLEYDAISGSGSRVVVENLRTRPRDGGQCTAGKLIVEVGVPKPLEGSWFQLVLPSQQAVADAGAGMTPGIVQPVTTQDSPGGGFAGQHANLVGRAVQHTNPEDSAVLNTTTTTNGAATSATNAVQHADSDNSISSIRSREHAAVPGATVQHIHTKGSPAPLTASATASTIASDADTNPVTSMVSTASDTPTLATGQPLSTACRSAQCTEPAEQDAGLEAATVPTEETCHALPEGDRSELCTPAAAPTPLHSSVHSAAQLGLETLDTPPPVLFSRLRLGDTVEPLRAEVNEFQASHPKFADDVLGLGIQLVQFQDPETDLLASLHKGGTAARLVLTRTDEACCKLHRFLVDSHTTGLPASATQVLSLQQLPGAPRTALPVSDELAIRLTSYACVVAPAHQEVSAQDKDKILWAVLGDTIVFNQDLQAALALRRQVLEQGGRCPEILCRGGGHVTEGGALVVQPLLDGDRYLPVRFGLYQPGMPMIKQEPAEEQDLPTVFQVPAALDCDPVDDGFKAYSKPQLCSPRKRSATCPGTPSSPSKRQK